jgi:hypothetical protein
MKYGILFDYQTATLMVESINIHIEQLKSKIRAEGLDREKYRYVFARLIEARRQLNALLGPLTTIKPGEPSTVIE